MVTAGLVLTTSRDVVVITAAQIVLALLVVAAGIHVSRLLNDAVPSTVRAGVASGVSTLTWIAFVPIGLAFGLLTEHSGVHTAGWTITAIAAAAGLLLVVMARTRAAAPQPATPSPCEPVHALA
jgi:hypothetical protein